MKTRKKGITLRCGNPRWRMFVDDLQDRIAAKGCGGGRDKTHAVRLLGMMDGVSVRKTCAYFDRHGGHCDCEIIYNVDQA